MKRRHHIKLLLTFALMAVFGFTAVAQKFYAQVGSKNVQVGQMFELAFVINASASDFTPPNFKDFDIAGGPNQSSSVQVINGAVSQNITLTYILIPKREGKLVIGPATITSGGKKLTTEAITIEASKGSAGAQQGASSGGNVKTDGSDVFVQTVLSKQKCYLGEQVIISQKFYSRHQMLGFQKFTPNYEGFWSQTLPSTSGNQQVVENVNGVNYYTYELFRHIASPNKIGKIKISAIEGDVIVRKQSNAKPRNIFEQFFGTSGYEDVAVKVKSKVISLDVLDLPAEGRPVSFNGAVGNFSYKAETSKQSVKANDAFNLKITISGKGNIKLIDAPKLSLPESFETYEPKVADGNNSKTFDYLIIPREQGEFDLNGLDFSYFNLDSKKYITIPSPNIHISVLAPDPNSAGAQVYNPKNEVKETENDIRYIKKGDFNLTKTNVEFFNSFTHILLLILPFVLLGVALGVRSKYVKNNSNQVAVRERKAAKVARKQLIHAEKLMNENKKDDFYTEILLAINHYLSNKLNIPLAEVSRDELNKQLTSKNVDTLKIAKLLKTIETSEYAKYAPGAVSGNLKEVYDDTVNLISGIEEELNTKKA
jgi:hypothetical protein